MYFLHAINSDRQTRLLNVLGQIALILGDKKLFNAEHVSAANSSILRSLGLICCVISWVLLLCKDRGFCISVLMQWRVFSIDVCFCFKKRVSAKIVCCGVLWLLSFLCVQYVFCQYFLNIFCRVYELTHTWFDACWCYVVVWLWWCGIRMQAGTLLVCSFGTWELGVNDRLEQGVGFSLALLQYCNQFSCWHCSGSGIAQSVQRGGRSGDRLTVEATLFEPVQIGSGTHPASYTMGTGSFPSLKRLGASR